MYIYVLYIFVFVTKTLSLKTNKQCLIDGEMMYRKRSKYEDLNMYGDGVAWFRGVMIGKGSFGCVFKASLKNPKARYSSYPLIMAVKSAEVSVSGSIQKEKQVSDNIGGCSNVVKCFGEEITNGENGQMVYNMLLEYASGGTLADLIKSSDGKGLDEFVVSHYTRSIVRGLSHIHKKGYVHCDLKPENVMLVADIKNGGFIAKIGDLGLAKRAKQNKKIKFGPRWRGTPKYFSPEVVINGVQEQPADIWDVGCIVFEMLTGKPLRFSDQNWCIDEILSRIGDENDSSLVSSSVSREGISFLKACLCRKVMCRLTAKMLLNHPFLKGLLEDDANVLDLSKQEVLDINVITSSTSFSDDDDCNSYDELSMSSYSNGSSCSVSWSERDVVSMENKESTNARFREVQRFPVTSTVSQDI